MVMLTRGSQGILAMLIALVSGVGSAHSADEAETPENERGAAVYAPSVTELAPPLPSLVSSFRFFGDGPRPLGGLPPPR